MFVLVGLYRTPGLPYDNFFLDKLDLALGILNELYENVILAEDININVLKYSKSYGR